MLTRMPERPSSFDNDLQKLVRAALAARVVDDQRVGKIGVDRANGDDAAAASSRHLG